MLVQKELTEYGINHSLAQNAPPEGPAPAPEPENKLPRHTGIIQSKLTDFFFSNEHKLTCENGRLIEILCLTGNLLPRNHQIHIDVPSHTFFEVGPAPQMSAKVFRVNNEGNTIPLEGDRLNFLTPIVEGLKLQGLKIINRKSAVKIEGWSLASRKTTIVLANAIAEINARQLHRTKLKKKSHPLPNALTT